MTCRPPKGYTWTAASTIGICLVGIAEGWRFQRDTEAYAGLYVDGEVTSWPPQHARTVDAALLEEKLAAAKRYRDM